MDLVTIIKKLNILENNALTFNMQLVFVNYSRI